MSNHGGIDVVGEQFEERQCLPAMKGSRCKSIARERSSPLANKPDDVPR
jgi:hypothetical protein